MNNRTVTIQTVMGAMAKAQLDEYHDSYQIKETPVLDSQETLKAAKVLILAEQAKHAAENG